MGVSVYLRRVTVFGVLSAFFSFSAYADSLSKKRVDVTFKGHFTQEQAAVYAQQIFNKLSPQSLATFSASSNTIPFSYSLSPDNTTLTFTFSASSSTQGILRLQASPEIVNHHPYFEILKKGTYDIVKNFEIKQQVTNIHLNQGQYVLVPMAYDRHQGEPSIFGDYMTLNPNDYSITISDDSQLVKRTLAGFTDLINNNIKIYFVGESPKAQDDFSIKTYTVGYESVPTLVYSIHYNPSSEDNVYYIAGYNNIFHHFPARFSYQSITGKMCTMSLQKVLYPDSAQNCKLVEKTNSPQDVPINSACGNQLSEVTYSNHCV